MTFANNYAAQKFYEKMGGSRKRIFGGYLVFDKQWDVACYEWLDVPAWVAKWEEMYDKK